MKNKLNIIFGILVGAFFTNAIWIMPSWESIVNVLFGCMCLIGILINFKGY